VEPGAAAWVIREVRRGGLSRTRPDVLASHWEEAGYRLRRTFGSVIKGLGQPLASSFDMFRMDESPTLEDLAVAIEIDGQSLTLAWISTWGPPSRDLPPSFICVTSHTLIGQ
jgi:hypothetical protein